MRNGIANRATYVIVGAGIHGLSTGYHLAKELKARGLGSGQDVVVLEKTEPGAGASGIACGVVRNNYFQPAMSELMQACVEVWESDPAAYAYNPVGYIALGPQVQESDLAGTYERQERIGYRSTFLAGEREVDDGRGAAVGGGEHRRVDGDLAFLEVPVDPHRPVLDDIAVRSADVDRRREAEHAPEVPRPRPGREHDLLADLDPAAARLDRLGRILGA